METWSSLSNRDGVSRYWCNLDPALKCAPQLDLQCVAKVETVQRRWRADRRRLASFAGQASVDPERPGARVAALAGRR
eukprot:2618005-Rhodomonas_salina.3